MTFNALPITEYSQAGTTGSTFIVNYTVNEGHFIKVILREFVP